MFNDGQLPRRVVGQLADARALYALLTGRVGGINDTAALDPATNQYVLHGKRRRAGQPQQLLALRPGLVADDADGHAQRRAALGRADALRAVNDTMSAASLADVCGVSGFGDGGIYNACRFFTPGASGGKVPEFSS